VGGKKEKGVEEKSLGDQRLSKPFEETGAGRAEGTSENEAQKKKERAGSLKRSC